MLTRGMRVDPTGDFIGATRNSEVPPTGGSLGTSKRCVIREDSDSIASVTASRNRLVQGNEKGAGLRLRDRQADQDGIDDALHRVVAQPVPRERRRSASHDPTHCERNPYPAARRDAIDPAISAAGLQAIPRDDRSSRALAPRRPSATAGSTGWPGTCPPCGRRETAGRDTRQAWEGTRGRA